MVTVSPTHFRPHRLFHWADYIVFGLLMAVSLAIGIVFSLRLRGKRVTAVDVLLGGRRMSMFPVSLSILATFLSTVLVLTVPAETFFGGVRIYMALAYIPATVAAAHIFVPLLRRLEVVSTYQYLGYRFNSMVRSFGSATFVVMMLLTQALSVFVPAKAFSTVAGVSLEMTMIGTGLVCTIYTTLGGFRAVVWADVVQVLTMIGGLIALLAVGASDVGGIDRVFQLATDAGRLQINNFQLGDTYNFYAEFLGGGVLWLSMFAANQTIVQRFCSVETCRKAQGSLYLAMAFYVIAWVLALLAGLVIFGFYASCDVTYQDYIDHPSQLLPLFIMDTLGGIHGVPGLVTGAIFGSILSSVSSAINSLAAVTLEDVVKPIRKRFGGHMISPYKQNIYARVLALCYGLVTIGLAYIPSIFPHRLRLVDVILSIFGVFGGPLLGVFILGALIPNATSMGATLGLLVGLAVLLWMWVGRLVCPNREEQLWDTVGAQSVCGGNATDYTTMAFPYYKCVLQDFYDVSFLWYALIGTAVTCLIGIAISFFTCGSEAAQAPDPSLLCCWKKKYMDRIAFVTPSRVNLSHIRAPWRRHRNKRTNVLTSQYHGNPLRSGVDNPLSLGDDWYVGMGNASTGTVLSSHMTSPEAVGIAPVKSQNGAVSSSFTYGDGQVDKVLSTGISNGIGNAVSGTNVLTSSVSVESSNLQCPLSRRPGSHYPQLSPRGEASPNPLSPGATASVDASKSRVLAPKMTSSTNASGNALW